MCLGKCVQSLMCPAFGKWLGFPVSLGAVPIIRCPRGNAAEMVAVVSCLSYLSSHEIWSEESLSSLYPWIKAHFICLQLRIFLAFKYCLDGSINYFYHNSVLFYRNLTRSWERIYEMLVTACLQVIPWAQASLGESHKPLCTSGQKAYYKIIH